LAHLSRLVDDLLDFARISRGEISLQIAPIDLNAVVEAAVEAAVRISGLMSAPPIVEAS
jgi:signal transduction histidine kinase